MTTRTDRFRGCLVGLALGDALGAPVEFLAIEQIKRRFGPAGIGRLEPYRSAIGLVTDDAQMARATAEAVLDAGGDPAMMEAALRRRYREWLALQDEPEHRRAPGMTCIAALRSGRPVPHSKGNGAVMRVAPVGLAFGRDLEACANVAAMSARITHGHAAAAGCAAVAACVVAGLAWHGLAIAAAIDVARCITRAAGLFDRETEAAVLAAGAQQEPAGEGWTADECLALALFLARTGAAPWAALCRAVNRTGDSDTVGALTGAFLGAQHGLAMLPADQVALVEDSHAIVRLADAVHASGHGRSEHHDRLAPVAGRLRALRPPARDG